jgi:DedD protein
MAASDDSNLDELRRRARRRLVGAIVLALAVAVFVPMLLESDRKPLGEDVSVRIPPVDDGKFVNKLNEKPKADVKAIARTEPPKPAAETVAAAAPPKVEAARTEPPKTESPKVEPAQPDPPKVETTKPEPPKPEPAKVDVAKVDPPKSEAPAASREPASGEFAVQVFAFSDDKGANSLVNKLKAKGFPAYSEPVTTSRGTLWRVRVGPFPSRDGAADAREKLKGEGYNGIVAAAK